MSIHPAVSLYIHIAHISRPLHAHKAKNADQSLTMPDNMSMEARNANAREAEADLVGGDGGVALQDGTSEGEGESMRRAGGGEVIPREGGGEVIPREGGGRGWEGGREGGRGEWIGMEAAGRGRCRSGAWK
jgi:hypothetical protein